MQVRVPLMGERRHDLAHLRLQNIDMHMASQPFPQVLRTDDPTAR